MESERLGGCHFRRDARETYSDRMTCNARVAVVVVAVVVAGGGVGAGAGVGGVKNCYCLLL